NSCNDGVSVTFMRPVCPTRLTESNQSPSHSLNLISRPSLHFSPDVLPDAEFEDFFGAADHLDRRQVSRRRRVGVSVDFALLASIGVAVQTWTSLIVVIRTIETTYEIKTATIRTRSSRRGWPPASKVPEMDRRH